MSPGSWGFTSDGCFPTGLIRVGENTEATGFRSYLTAGAFGWLAKAPTLVQFQRLAWFLSDISEAPSYPDISGWRPLLTGVLFCFFISSGVANWSTPFMLSGKSSDPRLWI